MTTEELVAKVAEPLGAARRRGGLVTDRELAEVAVSVAVEACAEEIGDCSCHGEDHCLCSCRRRIRKLGGTP